ncbi:MAG: DUF4388 domain-containing protein [Anaerolineales bacterium]|nr:DUF4388 domain-containing protein [Anaerolineales bacterium]MCS7247863.1 DUF4388 domain-containing protein [Anaerolineales bacterium]MDW8161673.1 DUF4388 domain-containing protein [Anaerolineales bacterium]MDW8446969.1 DUF4388 domain-containing protein [Anaerolineales bacterium]
MALRGNLKDFGLNQLLNLIHLAKKTGTLFLEGPRTKAWLAFREGKLAYGQYGDEDNSLAAILYNARKLNAHQFRLIKERGNSMNDKELGLLLVNAGYVSQQEVLASLQEYMLNLVKRLYTWLEGSFHFDSERLPPNDKINLRLNLENLLLEGARQLKEIEQLQDEIPSLDIALKFRERPETNVRNLRLSKEEWQVVSFINPKNTLKQIAQALRMNETEIRRVAYGLVQAGVVEFVRPERPIPQPVTLGIPNATPQEQVSLVRKIIQRIRSL